MNQLKGTQLGKEVETQFKQVEKGFDGEEDELSMKKSRKRERKEDDDEEADDAPDFKELHVDTRRCGEA